MTAPDPRLDAIKDRWADVTPGDWIYHESLSMVYARPEFDLHRFDQLDTDIFKVQERKEDGIAAAAAKADVAHLLSVVEAQAGQIAKVGAVMDDLDAARTEGRIHTYGQIQAAIRAALAPEGPEA